MKNIRPVRWKGILNVLKVTSKKIAIPLCAALVIPLFSSLVYAEGSENSVNENMDYYGMLEGEDYLSEGEAAPSPDPFGEQPETELVEEPAVVDNSSDLYLTDAVLNSALARYGIANKVNEYNPDTSYDGYAFEPEDWRLILINKTHSIPDDYTVELGTVYGSWTCDKRVIEDLLLLIRDARNAGTGLYIASPYRTSSLQVSLYNNKITKFMNTGMSYLEAYKLAGQAVTIPGTSEHEAGLCFDFLCDSYKSLSEGFEDTRAGQWLAANAHKYGFILRYPKEKEYITTIEYEPWHFRYVGVEAATVMYEEGITLEEFWEIYLD